MSRALPWLRLYDEALDDPKVQRLPDALFRHWINLLCLANRGEPRGRLPARLEDIAYGLRVTPRKCRLILDELLAARLLEVEQNTGRVMPNNWDERQRKSDSSAERVARHRERAAACNVTQPLLKRNSNGLEEEGDIPPVVPQAKPKRKSRIATALPEDFSPGESGRAFAVKHGWDDERIAFEVERFCTYHQREDKPSKDWPASWRTWVLNGVGYDRERRARRPMTQAEMNRGGTGKVVL